MNELLGTTTSTCRICGRLLPAHVTARQDGVWFEKICPAHGAQEARVHSDVAQYRKLRRFFRPASTPLAFTADPGDCPNACGLCPNHEQHVCMPIMEITDHCDLECPVCLVHNRGSYHRTPAEVERMLDILIGSEGTIDVLNISGGEPTLHPQFRDIVAQCVGRAQITRVSVSTNGRRLARDRGLLEFLAARRVIVSLQYDGPSEAAHLALRGRPLLEEKHRLIDQCAELDITMSLTATLAAGINDTAPAHIAEMLFRHAHISSIMFQPAAYAGRAASWTRPPNAITIPDVLQALDGAAGGRISALDFSPLPCGHPACFSLAFYLAAESNRFIPVKRLLDPMRYLDLLQNRGMFGSDSASLEKVNQLIYELWANPDRLGPDGEAALRAIKKLITRATSGTQHSAGRVFSAAERDLKSIFIHQFMDRDTFDLSRARKCCQVYPQPDGTLMPVCVRNCVHP